MSDKEKYASLTEVIPYIGKDRKKLESILQSKGIRDRQCSFFVTLLEEDWNLCQESDSVKYWALAHGFMPVGFLYMD